MATQLGKAFDRLRTVMAAQHSSDLPDHELLERFAVHRDEAAFGALMQRHGAMVLGVCRRMLHHIQDAEDDCQATFLVLARQASSVRKREGLGAWLYCI